MWLYLQYEGIYRVVSGSQSIIIVTIQYTSIAWIDFNLVHKGSNIACGAHTYEILYQSQPFNFFFLQFLIRWRRCDRCNASLYTYTYKCNVHIYTWIKRHIFLLHIYFLFSNSKMRYTCLIRDWDCYQP